MPAVLPFRAVRPADNGEPLEGRLSPPYDVIAPDERTRLAGSPHNPVHLILPQDDKGPGTRYAAAAKALERFQADGALVRDTTPAFYAYEQEFQYAGAKHTRRGFFGLLELSAFGERGVHAHERTLSAPREDRFRILEAVRANLSPVFVLYEDKTGKAREALDSARAGAPLARARTAEGSESLWALPDRTEDTPEARCLAAGVSNLAQVLAGQAVVLADGHHRYESALRYQKERRAAEPDALPPQAYDYMLACFVEAGDPGLLVLPTHRVLHGSEPLLMSELVARLDPLFRVEGLGDCADPDSVAWRAEAFLAAHPAGSFVAVTAHERVLTGFVLDPRRRAEAFRGSKTARPLQEVDVVALHELVFEKALGITGEEIAAQSRIEYVKSAIDAIRAARSGSAAAGAVAGASAELPAVAAFLMNATPVAQVLEIARAGERMPQKSTYFLPKITTGWVYHVHGAAEEVWGAAAQSRAWWPAPAAFVRAPKA